MELTLVGGAIAEEAGCHAFLALQLVGERETHGDRQAAAHDGVATVEAPADVEQVHRAAAAARAAVRLAVHLGHDRARRHTARERMAVLAVRGHHRVIAGERGHRARRNRFFSDVQVQEPADLLLGVELRALLFEAAHAQHLTQEGERLVGGDVELAHQSASTGARTIPASSTPQGWQRVPVPL